MNILEGYISTFQEKGCGMLMDIIKLLYHVCGLLKKKACMGRDILVLF